ncbi:MAG TPA: TlpA disulfide reductase family protein [Lacipirellulaceae bacterium]
MKASFILAAALWLVWLPLAASSQETEGDAAAAAAAEEPEAFDPEEFSNEIEGLLAQQKFDEASAQLNDALAKHPEAENLQMLHYAAAMYMRRAGRNEQAFEHMKAFTDFHLKAAQNGRGSQENFAQLVGMLADLATQIGGPDRAFAVLDEYAKQVEGFAESKDELKAVLETQRAIQLAKANRAGEAKALLEKQVEAANSALAENPNDVDAILRVAAALKSRVQLESSIDGGNPTRASSEHLEFLFTKAQAQPESMPLVQRFAIEHMTRAMHLARTNPDEASALLDRIESFDKTEEGEEAKEGEEANQGEEAAAQRPGAGLRVSFGPSIARLREQIENARKMLALIGSPALYPENADGWVNGEPLTADALKGKVVLLDFFAVWCGPCIATFPHLNEWHDEYADLGLTIIGVTNYYQYGWDEASGRPKREPELAPEAERAAMELFVKHHELRHPIAYVSDRQLQEHYFVSGIPHAVVIDRHGKVRLFRIGSGEANAADLKKAIQESLAESPPVE